MEVARSIEISRPIDEVFAFVADARNDPQWRPKVISTVQLLGGGPGPGARYEVVSRPLPMRTPCTTTTDCVGWDPPQRIEWREQDGIDDVQMLYVLSDRGGSTQLTQRSFLKPATPQRARPIMLRPIMRHGVGRDVELQLQALKGLLEERSS
jgi:uncharacterized membrane protein